MRAHVIAVVVAVVVAGLWLAGTAGARGEESAGEAGFVACGDHGRLVAALSERYREQPVSMGLQNNGNLLQVFASDETGSWTILSTATDGTSCILAVGEHFERRVLGGNDPQARKTPPEDAANAG